MTWRDLNTAPAERVTLSRSSVAAKVLAYAYLFLCRLPEGLKPLNQEWSMRF